MSTIFSLRPWYRPTVGKAVRRCVQCCCRIETMIKPPEQNLSVAKKVLELSKNIHDVLTYWRHYKVLQATATTSHYHLVLPHPVVYLVLLPSGLPPPCVTVNPAPNNSPSFSSLSLCFFPRIVASLHEIVCKGSNDPDCTWPRSLPCNC